MGVFFDPATLEKVRAASDIVDIIGAVVPLKRAGSSFVGLCPFHKEKTPSFHVTPHKQIFHCFGCHKGGDVFNFIKEYESVDFPDAVRRLAERAHIPLEIEQQPGAARNRHLKDQLLLVHEQITQRWQTALASDPAAQMARDYLAKRGVSAEAVQLFRLGYAPDLWDDTVNWAKAKHFEIDLIEAAGLVVRKEGSDHYYDRFRGRLMFPICDEQGRVIAFSGRILAGDDQAAKYVNSPESPIFTKGKVMFGLDKSKRALLDSRAAIICEGQLDLIACFMAGVQNVVAPQGTALTADHARVLKRYVDEVILCFDSDNAGQKAAVRSLDSLLASGLAIRVASVPAPHDPDSFIKERGGPAFAELIQQARGFFDYYLERLCGTNNPESDRGRQAIVEDMAEALHKTGSDLLLDTYAQKTALRLGVAADAVRAAFKKAGRVRPPRETSGEQAAPDAPSDTGSEPLPRPPETECWLLRLTLETDEFVEWIEAHLDPAWLTHDAVRDIINRRLHGRASGDWPGVAAWLSSVENPAWSALVTEILSDSRPIKDPEAVLKGSAGRVGAVKNLRDKFIDRELLRLTQKLADTALPPDDQVAFVQQMQSLRILKRQPLAPGSDA